MEELLKPIFDHLLSQCGLTTVGLFAFSVWQTFQLGKERLRRDRERDKLVEDSVARTRAAEAVAAAQTELVLRFAPTGPAIVRRRIADNEGK